MSGEFFSLVRHQRAHRAFEPREVDDELLDQLLDAATRAPSAENRQPWEFVVVRDPARRAAIGDLMRKAWRTYGKAFSEGRLSSELLVDVDRGAEGAIAAAPVLVVVCGNGDLAPPATLPSSVYPAVQNLLLAAGAVGLGSAMTTLAVQRADDLQAMLQLPAHVVPMAVIPLGWPARRLGPSVRVPAAERTHRETYGQPWRHQQDEDQA